MAHKKKSPTKQKLHIRTGDEVEVISGNHKGKRGEVLSIDREKQRAVVDGTVTVTRHVKPDPQNPGSGGREERQGTIHISNLMVVDASGEATRIGRKLNDKGKLQRYSKKSGEFIKEPKGK